MQELKQLAAFQQVLANYTMSEASLATLQATKLVLLVASTATGRNTLIREILKTGVYHYIVSDTTRGPRIDNGSLEQHGEVYWFRTEGDMLADLRAGKFLEAALIHGLQVSGISIRELKRSQKQSKIAITDIEIAGVATIMKAEPDTKAIFILRPSVKEWQERLHKRGAMDEQVYLHRMASAVKEFQAALDQPYYCFVINSDLQEAAERIHNIVTTDTEDAAYQKKASQVAEQLLKQTKALVNELQTGHKIS